MPANGFPELGLDSPDVEVCTPLNGNDVTMFMALLGILLGTDPDAGDTLSYSLTNHASGRFAINATTGQITVANGSLLNYEAATSYSIGVKVTDAGGLTYDTTFTINVTNVNEAPTDLALSGAAIDENRAAGTAVGDFSTTDPDAGGSFTYAFASGTGSTDNGSFTLAASGTLRSAAVFNYEAKSSYSIRVRTTDQGGLPFDKVFTIAVNN